MFDTQLNYIFVQNDKAHVSDYHDNCLIYKFFVRSIRTGDRRKYIVEVKHYENSIYTIDFYAKLSTRNHPNRYKLKTNQFTYGQVGATLLRIMADIITNKDKRACFGILAATLPEEKSDESNKRFKSYSRILRRVAAPQEQVNNAELNPFKNVAVLAIEELSTIFVLSEPRTDHEKQLVVERYQEIFREVF